MIKLTNETVNVGQAQMQRARDGLSKLRERKDLGFLDLPNRTRLWDAAEARASAVGGRLAVLGIGGSSLGGRAIMDAFFEDPDVLFFENVDGRDFWGKILSLPDREQMHWAVISKSGQTIETLGQTSFIVEHLESLKIPWRDNFTVITELKPNPLFNWAQANKIPVLEIPVDVGGRFSVLSPVGIFPAACSGMAIQQLREGAEWALRQDDLIVRLAAHSLSSWEREEWLTLFWVYCTRLWTWGLWVQQLWAESLAKKTDRRGKPAPRVSTPMPLIGANDQHSVLQQISEGARDKFIWFLRVLESETAGPALGKSQFPHQAYLEGKPLGTLLAAEAQATAKALQQNQVQSLTLEIDKLGPSQLGALFMLLELVVGSLGEALDINAFDQPGVELGKRLALDILK